MKDNILTDLVTRQTDGVVFTKGVRLGTDRRFTLRTLFVVAAWLFAIAFPACRKETANDSAKMPARNPTIEKSADAPPAGQPTSDANDAFRAKANEIEARLKKELTELDDQLEQHPKDAELYIKRAKQLRKMRSFVDVKGKLDLDSRAISDLETANRLAGDQGSCQAYIAIARIYLTSYQLPKTAEYIEKARALNPDDPDVRIEVAVLHGLVSNEWEMILPTLESIAQEPNMKETPRVWHAIGLARHGLKRFAAAREAFQKAIDLEPEIIERWTNIALTYADEGQLEQAQAIYDRVRSVDPTNLFAINNLASSLTQTKDPKKNEQAVQLLQQLLATAPGFPAAWNNLGNALSHLQRYKEAAEAYQRAISLVPCYVDAYDNLGIAFTDWGHHEDALTAYRSALACKPDNARLLYHMGNTLNNVGKHDEAIDAFKRAADLDPKDVRIWNNLGATYLDMGKLDEAAPNLDRAMEVDPRHALAIGNRGVVEMRRKQHAKAIPFLMRAIELNPTNRRHLSNLNISCSYSNVDSEVVRFYEELVKKSPDAVEPLFYKAGFEFDRGRFESAIEDFTRALKIAPRIQGANLQRGLAQLGSGHPQEAIRDFETDIELRSDYAYGRIYLCVAYWRLDDPVRASATAQTATQTYKKDDWGGILIHFVAGDMTAQQLLDKAETNENRCEALFVIAEHVRAEKGKQEAGEWYRKCVATCVKEFFEYTLCRAEVGG